MIHVVDYGLGNVQAFHNVYARLGFESVAARTPEELQRASRVILPGVGSFDHAMTLLQASGMQPVLEEIVQVHGVPVLGVCVGMQILGSGSDEGAQPGLGWVDGYVKDLSGSLSSSNLPIPHMGWNDVRAEPGNPLFAGLVDDAQFYFLHGYYFDCVDHRQSIARTEYGFAFPCAVQKDNVFGVQFHPEKSHHWGVALLKNFASL